MLKTRKLSIIFIMTAIDITTDIPSQINTLERLAIWAIMGLKRVNPVLAINVVANESPQEVTQAAIFQASDNNIYFNGTIFIKLGEDYAEDNTVKLWMKGEDISSTVLPAAFTTD